MSCRCRRVRRSRLTTAFYFTPGGRSIQRSLPGQLAQTTTGGGTGGINSGSSRRSRGDDALARCSGCDGVVYYVCDRICPARAGRSTRTSKLLRRFWTSFRRCCRRAIFGPGLAEWSRERDWIQNRLKQEILNQGVSVAKGDEIELQRDPVALGGSRRLSGYGNRPVLGELLEAREQPEAPRRGR